MLCIKNKIGELIKSQRQKQGLSRERLGRSVGCTGRAIQYWEAGEKSISLDMAHRLLEALDLTITIGKEA